MNTKVHPIWMATKDTIALWEKNDVGAHKVMVMGIPMRLAGCLANFTSGLARSFTSIGQRIPTSKSPQERSPKPPD